MLPRRVAVTFPRTLLHRTRLWFYATKDAHPLPHDIANIFIVTSNPFQYVIVDLRDECDKRHTEGFGDLLNRFKTAEALAVYHFDHGSTSQLRLCCKACPS